MMESLSISASEAVHDEKNALLTQTSSKPSFSDGKRSMALSVLKHKKKIVTAVLVCVAIGGIIAAIALVDDKQERLTAETLGMDSFVLNSTINPASIDVRWTIDGKQVLIRNSTALDAISIADGQRYTMISFTELVNGTAPIAVDGITLSPNNKWLLIDSDHVKGWRHSFKALYYLYNLDAKGDVTWLTSEGAEYLQNVMFAPVSTPAGELVAFVRSNDVYIVEIASKAETRVTASGSLAILNGVASWEYEEEIFSASEAIWWSSNSSFLAYGQFNVSSVPNFTIPFYVDAPYTSQLELPYPCPGYTNSLLRMFVYHIATAATIALDMSIDGLQDADRYVQQVTWADDERVMVLTLNRPQNLSTLLLCDVAAAVANNTGSCVCTAILKTTTPYWIEPEVSSALVIVEAAPTLKWIQLEGIGADGVVMPSLYELQGGVGVKVCTVATPSQASVTALLSATSTAITFLIAQPAPMDRTLYGASVENGVCGVPYEIGGSQPLTSLRGREGSPRVWTSASVNHEGTFAIMSVQSPTDPPVVVLTAVCCTVPPWSPLLLLDNSPLAVTVSSLPIPSISFVSVPSAQSGVNLNGYMLKPVNFDKSRSYPALIYVYGGPGSQTVMSTYTVSGKTNKFLLWMASQGYIVISVDGRGTGARGLSFMQQYTYRRLGVAEVEDQLAVVKYLKSLPFVNPARIGLWGWSYGGYMTTKTTATAALPGSDCEGCLKAAVAVAPVADWRFYDSVYTERYMSTPADNVEGYNISSVLPQLNQLSSLSGSEFLLVHGTGDDNVHFLNSAEILKVLVQRQVLIDVMVYPNQDHSISRDGAGEHVWRTIGRHFLMHL